MATETRAMFWTVLARLDEADTTDGDPWYAKGMAWAMENGISDGLGPDSSITREQLVTMLYRYDGSPAVDGFYDADSVSGFAAGAMRWAVERGIIGGTDGGYPHTVHDRQCRLTRLYSAPSSRSVSP